jgi:hypothetical protein
LRLSAEEVDLDVLHRPPIGPDGNENARSMVLAVRHAGHMVLLTAIWKDRACSACSACRPSSRTF